MEAPGEFDEEEVNESHPNEGELEQAAEEAERDDAEGSEE